MFEFIGTISGRRDRAAVYLITKLDYLYIGITEDHPAIRWGSHLATQGTFSELLRQIDRIAFHQNEPITFWAAECTALHDQVKAVQLGDALRLTEYYLHLRVKSNKNFVKRCLGKDYLEVISDVRSTTPRHYRNPICEDLADTILEAFLTSYTDTKLGNIAVE